MGKTPKNSSKKENFGILAHSNLHFRNEAPHYLTVELESTTRLPNNGGGGGGGGGVCVE